MARSLPLICLALLLMGLSSEARAADANDEAAMTCSQAAALVDAGADERAEELFKSVLASDATPGTKQCAVDGLAALSEAATEAGDAAAATNCAEAGDLAEAGADDQARELYKAVLESTATQDAKKCAVDGISDLSVSTWTGLGRALVGVGRVTVLVLAVTVVLYGLRIVICGARWLWLSCRGRSGPVAFDEVEDGTVDGTLETGVVGLRAAIREELADLGILPTLPGEMSDPIAAAAERAPLPQAAWAAKLFELARHIVLPQIGFRVTATLRRRAEYPELGMTLIIENRRNGRTRLVDSVWHGDALRLAKLAAWRVAQYASANPTIIRRARAGWGEYP